MRPHLRRNLIGRASLYGDLYLERELARLRRETDARDPLVELYYAVERSQLRYDVVFGR